MNAFYGCVGDHNDESGYDVVGQVDMELESRICKGWESEYRDREYYYEWFWDEYGDGIYDDYEDKCRDSYGTERFDYGIFR